MLLKNGGLLPVSWLWLASRLSLVASMSFVAVTLVSEEYGYYKPRLPDC